MSSKSDQVPDEASPVVARLDRARVLEAAGAFSMPKMPALCVRVSRACAMLGIGKTMFYELVEAGEIETIKVGRATLVTVSSLERLVTSRLSK